LFTASDRLWYAAGTNASGLFANLVRSQVLPRHHADLRASPTQVTTQVLLDSNAGKLVRRLTKHADAGIAAAAVQVVAAWKDAIAREQRAALGDAGAAGIVQLAKRSHAFHVWQEQGSLLPQKAGLWCQGSCGVSPPPLPSQLNTPLESAAWAACRPERAGRGQQQRAAARAEVVGARGRA